MSFIFEEETKKQDNHYLWVEKYRPDTLEGYIGSEHLKETIKSFIDKQDIPHLMFYGSPGVGKCLDYSQEVDVEIDLNDQEYNLLKKYELLT